MSTFASILVVTIFALLAWAAVDRIRGVNKNIHGE